MPLWSLPIFTVALTRPHDMTRWFEIWWPAWVSMISRSWRQPLMLFSLPVDAPQTVTLIAALFLGLYAHQRLEDSPFSPSPNSPDTSQLTSSGSALPVLASDPMVPSPSWPSLAPPSAPSPTPSPVRMVPSGAPLSSLTDYGSAPPSSFLRALSPGEQRLYGPGFRLDAPSDSDYHPSGNVASPSPPHIAPRIEAAPPAVPRATASGFAGSGFALSSPSGSSIEQGPPPQLLTAPTPVSRRYVQFASATKALL